jgi:hypothetical protein
MRIERLQQHQRHHVEIELPRKIPHMAAIQPRLARRKNCGPLTDKRYARRLS